MRNSVHNVKSVFTSLPLQTGGESVVSLFVSDGHRKYLTTAERRAFLQAVDMTPADVRTFLLTLAYTGARISEVLSLTRTRVDIGAGLIIIECLKKRRRGVFRGVSVPEILIEELDRVHNLTAAETPPYPASERFWPWCRTTGWHHVKECMDQAGVVGPQASPKALRHGFAVGALNAGVPVTLLQKWLGRSRLTTTAIYADAVGTEERTIAS